MKALQLIMILLVSISARTNFCQNAINFDGLTIGKGYEIKTTGGSVVKGVLISGDSSNLTVKAGYKVMTVDKKLIKEVVQHDNNLKNKNADSDLLPFVKRGHKPPIVDPRFSFGLSYSYADVDMKPIESFFAIVENNFIGQGYKVPRNNINFSAHSMYLFNFYVRLFNTFGSEFEVANSPNDVNIDYAGAYIDYYLKFADIRWFRPHFAIGWGSYSFNTEHSYGDVQVDPNGGMLDKIVSKGSSNGIMLKVGSEFGLVGEHSMPIALNLSLSRSFLPEITNDFYGYKTIVDLSSFRFSAGLRVFL